MDNRQTLQYLCGRCNTVLKESERADIDSSRVTEACPNCGLSLASTLTINRPCGRVEHAAFWAATNPTETLTFGIKQLDIFYSSLRKNEIFFITGRPAVSLITRLCVRAMLPKLHGGLQSNVLFIDAGNTSDFYQCVSFARQYGMDLAKILNGIIVSRAFTVHQLASLIITEMPEAVKRFGTNLVIISGLLRMFLEDPQVDKKETRRLLEEMMIAVKRISHEVLVVISTEETGDYENIFYQFKNRLELHVDAKLVIVNATSKFSSNRFSLPEKVLRVVEGG